MRRSFFFKTAVFSVLFLPAAVFSGDFTNIYPGARANSMGSAFASIADDPYAVFYNPAGLVQMRTVQLASGIARRRTPLGDMADLSIAYSRPLPFRERGVFGFGYDAIRHSQLGNRDTFLFGYSDTLTLKYLQLPMLWGSNFRIVSLRYPKKSHFGLGMDAGVIFRSFKGLRTGLVLSDLDTGMGRSFATLTLANSYRYEDTTFAMDLRVRGGYAEFFPGIERSFYNDLFRARIGKGINVNGVDYLALGFGYNLDPLVCNFTYSLPWDGFKAKGGVYEMSLTYKFEAPTFNEKMVIEASQRLKEINSRIEDLNKQKNSLEVEVARYQTGKGILESDLAIMQSRLLELQEKVKTLEIEAIDAQFKKQEPPPRRKVVKTPEVWPKYHKVQSGDTLRSIASKYYGNQNLWQIIYDANQDKIFKGLPAEGSMLRIPPPVDK